MRQQHRAASYDHQRRRNARRADRAYLIHTTHAGGERCRSLDEPMPKVPCGNRGEMALIEPFLVKDYNTGDSQSIDAP